MRREPPRLRAASPCSLTQSWNDNPPNEGLFSFSPSPFRVVQPRSPPRLRTNRSRVRRHSASTFVHRYSRTWSRTSPAATTTCSRRVRTNRSEPSLTQAFAFKLRLAWVSSSHSEPMRPHSARASASSSSVAAARRRLAARRRRRPRSDAPVPAVAARTAACAVRRGGGRSGSPILRRRRRRRPREGFGGFGETSAEASAKTGVTASSSAAVSRRTRRPRACLGATRTAREGVEVLRGRASSSSSSSSYESSV